MSSVEEIRASRPREPGRARVALIVAVVLWVPVVGDLSYYMNSAPMSLALILVVVGAFGVVKGRHSGRVMATFAIGGSYLFLVPTCWLGFSAPDSYGPALAVMDIVAVLLSVVALHWLYHPATSQYIQLVAVARQAEQT